MNSKQSKRVTCLRRQDNKGVRVSTSIKEREDQTLRNVILHLYSRVKTSHLLGLVLRVSSLHCLTGVCNSVSSLYFTDVSSLPVSPQSFYHEEED